MREAPWTRLVRTLVDAGYESPYLDRLRRRVDVEQAHASLEQEIIREMAGALGRAEDKLNAALLRVQLAGDAVAAAPSGEERRRRALEFNACRREAEAARWELVIQREAVGIRRNDVLERLYPIPPPLRIE
jgi:hypothetical protein